MPYIPGEEEPYSPVDDDDNATNIHLQVEELTRKIEKEKLVIQILTATSKKVNADADVSIIVIKFVGFKLHFNNYIRTFTKNIYTVERTSKMFIIIYK